MYPFLLLNEGFETISINLYQYLKLIIMAYLVTPETQILKSIHVANPWNNDVPAQFNICVQYKGGVVPAHAAYDKRSRLQGYLIHSASDNKYRYMPDALARLWLDGKVPTQQLPALLQLTESRPEKKDITPYLTLNSTQRVVRFVGVILLGIITGLLGWLLHREGLAWGLGLSAGGILFSILYLVHLQRMKARRTVLTEWILAQLIVTGKRP